MKKLIVVLLVITMLALALVACGGDDTTAPSTNKTPTTTTPKVDTTTAGTPTTTKPATPTTTQTPTPGTTVTPTPGTTVTPTPGTTVTPTPGTTVTPNTTVTPGTTETPGTTVAPTTSDEPATGIYRDPAKVYHIDSVTYKTTNKDQDREFIYYDQCGSNGNERFCDGDGFIFYAIPLADMIEPSVTITIRQQYYVAIFGSEDIVGDDTQYIKIADFNDVKDDPKYAGGFNDQGAYTAGSNHETITINPYEYEIYETLYIYIANSNPTTGWGGTIMTLTINQYLEGKGPEITTIDNSLGKPNYPEEGMIEQSTTIICNDNDEDEAYIFQNACSANGNHRYCDNSAFIIYRFDVRNLVQPSFVIGIEQNYKIEISHDGESWVEVANWANTTDYAEWHEAWLANGADSGHNFVDSGDLESGGNYREITIDPYNIPNSDIQYTGQVYLRISDCFPDAGWGGAIKSITLNQYVNP